MSSLWLFKIRSVTAITRARLPTVRPAAPGPEDSLSRRKCQARLPGPTMNRTHAPWRRTYQLRRGRRRPQHRLLYNRQIDHGRQYAEHHREPPHDIVRAGALVQQATHPGTKKTAHLMAEKSKTVEC